MNPVAEKIARRRKESGMTQREMAEKLNVSDKTLSRWETGKQIPDAFMIRDIANVLNMTVSEIYDEEKNEESISCLPEKAQEKSARKRIPGKKILKIAAAGIVGTAGIIALMICAANFNLKSKVSYELKNVPIYALTSYDHSVLDWIKACDASGEEIHCLSSLRYDAEAGEDIAGYLFYLPHGNQDTEVDVRYQVGMGARTLKLHFKNKTQLADDKYCLCYVELAYDQENFEKFRVQTYLDAERIHYGTTGTASFAELCEVLFDVDLKKLVWLSCPEIFSMKTIARGRQNDYARWKAHRRRDPGPRQRPDKGLWDFYREQAGSGWIKDLKGEIFPCHFCMVNVIMAS